MKIKAFGKITEIINKEISIDFPIILEDFQKNLEQEFPALKGTAYSIAINEKIISDKNFIINSENIIAVLPPFSGG